MNNLRAFAPIDTLFASMNMPMIRGGSQLVGFKVDIIEKKDEFLIQAELPGVEKDKIEVSFKEGALSISAQNEEKFEEKQENKFLRMERNYSKKSRTFVFEQQIDEENIQAKYENGILELILPKKERQELIKKIQVQ